MQIAYLLTTKEVENYLTNQGLDASDPNFTKNLIIYRLAAHKKICNHLGYEIIENSYVDEYYDGNGSKKLYLLNRPVTEVTEVKLEDAVVDGYELIDNYLFIRNGWVTPGCNNYKVSYKAGWTQAKMPGDIKHTALQLISLYVGQLGGSGTTIGKASVSDGSGGSESIDVDAETRLLSSLDHYINYAKL